MTGRDNLVEMDRAVASIHVGHRQRRDLGDLDELAASIAAVGLLQPITITPGGLLVCGARRLAAVTLLGWRTVNVWVRAGMSTPLQQLLAEQHENTMRQPLAPTEAADLYRELKALLAEDAARRQARTRLGTQDDTGAAESAATLTGTGDSRARAAQLVTGRRSYTRLEQVGRLQQLAQEVDDEEVRRLATDALREVDQTGKVNGAYRRVMRLVAPPADGEADSPTAPSSRPWPQLRRFLLGLEDLTAWVGAHDPTLVGPALGEEQWHSLTHLAQATTSFVDAAGAARRAATDAA